MPRNSSAWVDIKIHLIIIAGLLVLLAVYNFYVAVIGMVMLVSLYIYGRERCRDRQQKLEAYYENVARNVNELSNYAIDNLPVGIVVLNHDNRLAWYNNEIVRWMEDKPDIGSYVKDIWPEFDTEFEWGQDGEYVLENDGRFWNVIHRPVFALDVKDELMVFYITDVTDVELMKRRLVEDQTVLLYIQIDNYDEVLQGMTVADRTNVVVAVNSLITEWIDELSAFIRRISEDMYIAVMNRQALEKALNDKFDVIDKVRSLSGRNKYPVTLSMGVAVGRPNCMAELGRQAQAGLDLALGRGGDQVAVYMEGKAHFYGGKAKAVEKHTRVKARVVAHAVNEIMSGADIVLVMGHHNEDFDSLGAAIGVLKMAQHLNKPAYIVLSEMNEGIDKFVDMIRAGMERDIFVKESELAFLNARNPLVFVVDTHIPTLTAAPSLLNANSNVVIIDHHRRSENFIANPILTYLEPASSSTSELVTELLMYFSNDIELSRLEASALYAGIIVDTKNFAVQTGVRTFDAAAYLRRSGADPQIVHELFRSDYETSRARAMVMSNAEFFKGGLIVAQCPENTPNAQVTAARTADAMLRIEDVRMSLVLFHLEGGVGISARSTGEINVQVIMEKFGGGGHQNVAGAQVFNANIDEIKREAVEHSLKYIEESAKT